MTSQFVKENTPSILYDESVCDELRRESCHHDSARNSSNNFFSGIASANNSKIKHYQETIA